MSTVNESPTYNMPEDDLADIEYDGDLLALGLENDDVLDDLMGAKPGQREPGWRRLERAREKKLLRLNMRDFQDFDDIEDYDDLDTLSEEYYSDYDH